MFDVLQPVVGIVTAGCTHNIVVRDNSLRINAERRGAVIRGTENCSGCSVLVLGLFGRRTPVPFKNRELFAIPVLSGSLCSLPMRGTTSDHKKSSYRKSGDNVLLYFHSFTPVFCYKKHTFLGSLVKTKVNVRMLCITTSIDFLAKERPFFFRPPTSAIRLFSIFTPQQRTALAERINLCRN